MAGLFDLEMGFVRLIADEAGRMVEVNWLTAGIYALTLIIGISLSGWLQNRAGNRQPRDAAFMDAGASSLNSLAAVGLSAVLALGLFFILTGRFFLEYLILIVLTLIGSRIYFVVADALMGIQDSARKDKIRVMANMHMSSAVGCLSGILLIITFGALLFIWYVALMTSFRSDLDAGEIQARIAVLLFAVPAVISFVVMLPIFLSILTNRLLDGEVRGFALSRLLPFCITSSLMVVFPHMIFGDVVQDYVPYLPRLNDLIWLPVGLFVAFGILPYALGALNHRALVSASVKWHRRWLQQVVDGQDDEKRLQVQADALVTEMRRMVTRGRYFENYLLLSAVHHYHEDREQVETFADMLGMSDGAMDGRQFDIIDGHFADLAHWDRLTLLVDDLFLYWCHFEEDSLTSERVRGWQSKLASDDTVAKGSILSPILGTIGTAVAGWALNLLYPVLERSVAGFFN